MRLLLPFCLRPRFWRAIEPRGKLRSAALPRRLWQVKAIPNRALRKNVSRIARIWFKFLAQASNDRAHIFGPALSILLPGGLREILKRERHVGVSDQELQNEKLFGGETAYA